MRALKHRIMIAAALLVGVSIPLFATAAPTEAANPGITFNMVRSAATVKANCLTNATATVHVVSHELVQTMTVRAAGLPAHSRFDLFVTQLPNAPFGVSWYQSDLQADAYGNAAVIVVGRFSVETFAVAPGSGAAPTPHSGIDASSNPPFAPIHTFHIGFWFNSPADAAKAGCPTTVTPFNGEHTAGIQAMSTRNFADTDGPLGRLTS
jgi:hypothetical protein